MIASLFLTSVSTHLAIQDNSDSTSIQFWAALLVILQTKIHPTVEAAQQIRDSITRTRYNKYRVSLNKELLTLAVLLPPLHIWMYLHSLLTMAAITTYVNQGSTFSSFGPFIEYSLSHWPQTSSVKTWNHFWHVRYCAAINLHKNTTYIKTQLTHTTYIKTRWNLHFPFVMKCHQLHKHEEIHSLLFKCPKR